MTIRKTLRAMFIAAVVALPSTAFGQLVAYDGFDNGPLADLDGSVGGSGWTTSWLDVMYDQPTYVTTTGLTYPGLLTAPGAAVTGAGSSGYPLSRYYRAFSSLPRGTTSVYVSFLMRADSGMGSWGGLSFGTYPLAMYVGSPLGAYSYGLMVSEGLADYSNAQLIEGETALLVVKISKNTPGAGITYRLYVNPTVGAPEPANPDAIFGIAQVGSLPNALNIDNQGGFTTDEIRVATTWASAVPAAPACVGDFNHNDNVEAGDLAMLLGQWSLPGGDVNGDGTTDASDLAILLGAWGPCP